MATYRIDHVELHTPDLNTLSTVIEPQHVRENELAQMYRSNKYNLRMSSVPFELFLNYLQDNKFMLLLRVVNQYLNIQGKKERQSEKVHYLIIISSCSWKVIKVRWRIGDG
jgi:transcription initiation factor TFIID subunit 5